MKIFFLSLALGLALVRGAGHLVALRTNFGAKDGAEAAMRGVAMGVSPKGAINDLSHEKTPFDIWAAADCLKQAAPFWPAGTSVFDDVGPLLRGGVEALPHEKPRLKESALIGTAPYLDCQSGNVWTSLDGAWLTKLTPKAGGEFRVTNARAGRKVFTGETPYARPFGEVRKGTPLLNLNSLMIVAFASNVKSFVKSLGVGCGDEWSRCIEKVAR